MTFFALKCRPFDAFIRSNESREKSVAVKGSFYLKIASEGFLTGPESICSILCPELFAWVPPITQNFELQPLQYKEKPKQPRSTLSIRRALCRDLATGREKLFCYLTPQKLLPLNERGPQGNQREWWKFSHMWKLSFKIRGKVTECCFKMTDREKLYASSVKLSDGKTINPGD